jgi:arylsulfatase A-like enzyme
LFIFYSDNGYAYGEHRNKAKNCLYEECIRVPMIISYPPMTKKAVVSQSFAAANIDAMATILDIAGVSPHDKINGKSLTPLLKNPTSSVRDEMLIEAYNNKILDKDYGIRTKQYTYIENATGEKELYDLIQDPYELINLASKPEYQTVVTTMSSKLAKMEVE